tara:strand:+ start:1059 stop:1493 length:435 start_codon:yes stop_codon:yes gene_type:complete
MTRLTDLDQKKEKIKVERIALIGEVVGTFMLAFILLILIFGKKFDYCEHINEIKSLDFSGVVQEKVDNMWDHGSHGLDIETNDSEVIYLSLTEDENLTNQRLWKIVSEGDSIKKFKNEFVIWTKVKNEQWKKTKLVFSETQCRK